MVIFRPSSLNALYVDGVVVGLAKQLAAAWLHRIRRTSKLFVITEEIRRECQKLPTIMHMGITKFKTGKLISRASIGAATGRLGFPRRL